MKSLDTIFFIVIFLSFMGKSMAMDFYNRLGFIGGYSYNFHLSSFKAIPGIPNCCPLFEKGAGGNSFFGFNLEMPLKLFSNFTGLSYRSQFIVSGLDAELIYIEKGDFNLIGTDEPGEIEHSLKSEYLTFSFEPNIGYNVTNNFKVTFGGRIAKISYARFSQIETLIKPAGRGYFQDTGSRTRNDTSASIPFYKDHIYSLTLGISYDLPMNSQKTLFLTPELTYIFPLNSLNGVLDWKVHSYRAGLSLCFVAPVKPIQEIRTKYYIIDTLVIENEKNEIELFIKGDEKIIIDTLKSDDLYINTTIY